MNGVKIPWDELSMSSEEDDEEDDDDSFQDTTELEQLVAYIGDTITCLLRISMVIQKPAPHSRFIKSGRLGPSFSQPWDENHVREKFRDIPEWLTRRLGKAISHRRQFLEYRKSHQKRIASVGDDTATVVSSLPTVAKQDQDPAAPMKSEILDSDNKSEAGASQTSYAETVANEDTLFIPKMPEAAQDGALFECPYCFMIIGGIQSRFQWK